MLKAEAGEEDLTQMRPPAVPGRSTLQSWSAEPPRVPAPSRALQRARDAYLRYRNQREELERRSIARGLLWLAVLALMVSMARAGLDRVFVHGWWNQW